MSDNQKTKNVGAHAYDLLSNNPEHEEVEDLRREMQDNGDYFQRMEESISEGCNHFPGDFFICVLHKKEKLMPNSIRNYFVTRRSCPTPQYDQTVYRYDRSSDQLTFIWTVPDQMTAAEIYNNALNMPDDQKWLRDLVCDFFDGELLRLAQRYNHEDENHIIQVGV